MKPNLLWSLVDILNHPEWSSVINHVRRWVKDFDRDTRITLYGRSVTITSQRHTKLIYETSRYLERAALRGAKVSELARLVKYGLVVVDAQKYCLDYTKAREYFGIDDLVEKYSLET